MLATEGLELSKHGAVHAEFGARFAKPDRVDRKLHRWLLDAFDKRILADYGVEAEIRAEDAGVVIEQAAEFVRIASSIVAAESGN